MSQEQRINLKFLVKLGKKPSECLQMMREVYGDDCMSQPRLYDWQKRFCEVRESVDDDQRSGRPSTARNEENMVKVKALVRTDRRLTIRMMSEKLQMNKESIRLILNEDLGMRKICAKMVSRLLKEHQKQQRQETAEQHLEQLQGNPNFLDNVRVAPCDFWLFPKLKQVLKGSRFEGLDDIKDNVTRVLRSLPVEDFQQCTKSWPVQLNRCRESREEYFEGCH